MKNIPDHEDYNRYQSTKEDSEKNNIGPVICGNGKEIIFFIIIVIIAFITAGAGPGLILLLLSIGLIIYKIIKSIM